MKILSVFGTRPEAIKMAPLVRTLSQQDDMQSVVCVTGQHRQMLDQVLDVFDIAPDHDLSIMRPNQNLTTITTAVLEGLQDVLAQEKPDWVLVHGDTTTSMAAAMAAFYARVPVGHVEAGLRTGNMDSPWPEEMNRCVVDRISAMMFAPTPSSRRNLLAENLDAARIAVTGNTVIDALHIAQDKVRAPAQRAASAVPGPSSPEGSAVHRAHNGRLRVHRGHCRPRPVERCLQPAPEPRSAPRHHGGSATAAPARALR